MSRNRKAFSHIVLILVCVNLLISPIAAWACASCGCSEVCPVAMMDASEGAGSAGILSDSIWGNMILKMAYSHDAELQTLLRKRRLVNNATVGSLAGISGATLGQNVTAIATLNPPEGVLDSYAPGIVGIVLESVIGAVIGGNIIFHHGLQKKVNARRQEIRREVEAILDHLEFSDSKCPEAQDELAKLIGERGAQECLQLWHSSHVTASIIDKAPQQSKIESSVDTLIGVANNL